MSADLGNNTAKKINLLLTPGPTKVPEQVYEALSRPIIHHRTPQFQEYLKEAVEGLQYVFQTKNDVYIMSASGTGALEASVCNLLSPGDKAIAVNGGKFGERWVDLCKVYGANAVVLDVEWGKAPTASQIKELLDANPDTKAVFITLCETSTGVTPDIKAIAETVNKTDAVLVVDAVSGLGATDLQMDNWGVGVVASGSQKGFMLPPGLAFISLNEKAFSLVEKSTNPKYYFDLKKAKKAAASTDTPFTPAISLVVALLESLKIMKEAGLENLFAHYEKLARGTRAAAKALGLGLLADESCISNVVTSILVPDGIDGGKLVKTMRDRHGVTMAGGQGHLKGKIIRMAHMGCLNEEDALEGIACLEKVLQEMGYQFSESAGQAAAKKVFSAE